MVCCSFPVSGVQSLSSSVQSTPEKNGNSDDASRSPELLQEFLKSGPKKELLRTCLDKDKKQTASSKSKMTELMKTGNKTSKKQETKKASSCPNNQLSIKKQQRKGENPMRLVPSSEQPPDFGCSNSWICKNSACRAVLSIDDTLCKRCSCSICHLFDDNKDPSLWLVCTSESGQGDSCELSCHVECALQREKVGVVDLGQLMQLDGSYCCASCGKVSGILGSTSPLLSVMASTKPVNILEICHVSPSSTSPESSTELSLPLIFSDIFNLKFPPVQGIFFYKLTELTPTFFNSVILPKVKHSLSLTLSHFRPLAGNLTWPPTSTKPIITYNTPEDGIKLTVAESSADFERLYNEIHHAIESHPYVPNVSISDTIASTLAIQITLFPNKGFCIGHTTNHAVLDGLSTSFFMNARARICKQLVDGKMESPTLLPEELTPFFNRTIVQDPEGLDMWYLKFWLGVKSPGSDNNPRSLKPFTLPETPPNLLRTTFELYREEVQKLGEMVTFQLDISGSKEETNQTKPVYFSTYVLVYAHTLVCALEAKGLNSNEKIKMLVTVDCRSRLSPPLPKNYIGNCVSSFDTVMEGEALMKENGVAYVAKRLNEMIKGLDNRSVLEGAKERLPYKDCEPNTRQVRSVGTNRFGMYGVDFGWGKPSNVEVTTIDRFGSLSIMESKDESGGVEVGVVLKEHEMKIFRSLFTKVKISV